jgi:hypothetical protein
MKWMRGLHGLFRLSAAPHGRVVLLLMQAFQRLIMSDAGKKDLVLALTALIKERRSCAQLLSKPYERGTYEPTMARFVELQTTIEAVERALVSEGDYP